MDTEAKKNTLRMIPYGLYVVTAKQGDRIAGMTVNFMPSRCLINFDCFQNWY